MNPDEMLQAEDVNKRQKSPKNKQRQRSSFAASPLKIHQKRGKKRRKCENHGTDEVDGWEGRCVEVMGDGDAQIW